MVLLIFDAVFSSWFFERTACGSPPRGRTAVKLDSGLGGLSSDGKRASFTLSPMLLLPMLPLSTLSSPGPPRFRKSPGDWLRALSRVSVAFGAGATGGDDAEAWANGFLGALFWRTGIRIMLCARLSAAFAFAVAGESGGEREDEEHVFSSTGVLREGTNGRCC